jgi:plasmid segregation protein ParM
MEAIISIMMKFEDIKEQGEHTTMAGYKVYPYGHDFGNAGICGILFKGNTPVMLSEPTAFSKVDLNRLDALGVETKDASVIRLENEAAQWGIGNIALAQASEPWDGRGDILRYANKHSLRALLTLSGKMTNDKEYGLMVVGGLPAEPFQKHRGLKNEIKKALTGTYVFTLDGKTSRTAHVEYSATLMEGAGALAAYAKKGNTGPQGAAVIDVGGRTTDLYVARAGVPIGDYCVGKPLGVATAARMLQQAFEQKYEFPLTALDTQAILYAYANSEGLKKKAYPEISKYGEKIPAAELEALTQEAILETTNEIVSFVSSAWRESDSSLAVGVRFDPVIMIGGGVHYFYEALKRRIPHLQKPENPTFSNAYGYARAAALALEKKIKKEKEAEEAAAALAAEKAAAAEVLATAAEAAEPQQQGL